MAIEWIHSWLFQRDSVCSSGKQQLHVYGYEILTEYIGQEMHANFLKVNEWKRRHQTLKWR